MSDDEREVQIRVDAEQYIPFPLDEVSLDFEVLPDRLANPNRVNVLLVATRTKTLKHALKCLNWNLNLNWLMSKVTRLSALLACLLIAYRWVQIP